MGLSGVAESRSEFTVRIAVEPARVRSQIAPMNTTTELPTRAVMLEAFLERDTTFDGIFVTGVSTTGIFCRPDLPSEEASPRESLVLRYAARRAPRRAFGHVNAAGRWSPQARPPEWLQPLLDAVEEDSEAEVDGPGRPCPRPKP